MTGIRRWNDRWFHDGTSEKDARNRAIDRLEPSDGQSDGTPTPGIWHQIPKRHGTAPLTLSYMPGILSDLEWDLESFEPEAMGR